MNKGFLILFFICFSFVALQNKNKYNVKIEDANEDQDKDIGLNHIRLGLFKKFIVKVIPDGIRYKAKANLTYDKTLTPNIFVVNNVIMIDTHTALEYPIYIGTNCSNLIETNAQIDLNFEIREGEDKEMFNAPNKVTVEFVNQPVTIQSSVSSKIIPSDSYAIYRTEESVRNVDRFTLTYTQKTGDPSINVLPLTVTPFKGERSHLDEKISGKIIANYLEDRKRTSLSMGETL